jgi:hypothetical protein
MKRKMKKEKKNSRRDGRPGQRNGRSFLGGGQEARQKKAEKGREMTSGQ